MPKAGKGVRLEKSFSRCASVSRVRCSICVHVQRQGELLVCTLRVLHIKSVAHQVVLQQRHEALCLNPRQAGTMIPAAKGRNQAFIPEWCRREAAVNDRQTILEPALACPLSLPLRWYQANTNIDFLFECHTLYSCACHGM